MVEWDPIMGVIPPLSETEWQAAFAKYQQYPEYRLVNQRMSLNEFKNIFLVEYAHRILGRTIGLAFLVPLLFFWLRGSLSRGLWLKLAGIFVLGGLQGLLGWYMVKSGLVDRPHVSQYRLTAHLLFAVAIYGYILWVALELLRGPGTGTGKPREGPLAGFSVVVLVALTVMIASGGFVAGSKAGFAFNTFPLMHGRWVPEGVLALEPAWRNLFENIATIQFTHRLLAVVVAALIVAFWFATVRSGTGGTARNATHLLLAMLAIQLALGVTTLVYVVPVPLAAAHQAGALLLWTLALVATHALWRPGPRAVQVAQPLTRTA